MKQINKQAFSLIEVLIGMLIFIVGMVSIYAVISSTMRLNIYNKDYIIASGLAREQLELMRNIRDTNFAKIQNFKLLNPNFGYSDDNIFQLDTYYKIQNEFDTNAPFPISAIKSSEFIDSEKSLIQNKEYKLCLNQQNLYVYCDTDPSGESTPFYRYIKIEPVKKENGTSIENAFMVVSRVVWINRGYHDFEIRAIFTDYKIF